jgi:hypothetical protein
MSLLVYERQSGQSENAIGLSPQKEDVTRCHSSSPSQNGYCTYLNVLSQSGAMKMSTSVSDPLSAAKSPIVNYGLQQFVARRLNVLEALEYREFA